MTVSLVARGSAVVAVLLAATTVTPGAEAVAGPARRPLTQLLLGSPLTFGVTVNQPAPSSLPLLHLLRGDAATFGVHDYVSASDPPAQTLSTLAALHTIALQGYPVTLTLDDESGDAPPPSVDAFVAFVRGVVAAAGSWLHAVEITNEPNIPSASTSDGANPAIVTDLVRGVVAAKAVARQQDLPVLVGFDFAYTYGSLLDVTFWLRLQLAAALTPGFASSVDWMGLHAYPNPGAGDVFTGPLIAPTEVAAMRAARGYLDGLLLGRQVPISVTEVGYPTSRGTSEYGVQASYWRAVLGAFRTYGGSFGVDSVFVFLLRDRPFLGSQPTANSYGIFDAQGVPKPAAAVVAAAAERSG
jgi:hypothetical protein